MPLSIVKLQKLLNINGFFINSLFTIEGQAVYLDLFYSSSADNFILYIPSRYEINVGSDLESSINVYPLKYIDEKELSTKHSEFELEKEYNKIDSYLEADTSSLKNVEKVVTENYDKDISLEKLDMQEVGSIKDISDQIGRFKLCVKNIKYKICIMSRNYFACVRRDNDIDLFMIERIKPVNIRKFFIIVDMETLFADPVNSPKQIKGVKQAIYKILSENQLKHSKLLNVLLTKQTDMVSLSNTISKQKQLLDFYLNHLEDLLSKTLESEKEKLDAIVEAKNSRTSVTGISSFYSDMDKGNQLSKLEKELQEINNIKHDIVSEIMKLRNRQENLSLEIDRILCENILSINSINTNFHSLSKFI